MPDPVLIEGAIRKTNSRVVSRTVDLEVLEHDPGLPAYCSEPGDEGQVLLRPLKHLAVVVTERHPKMYFEYRGRTG